MPSDFEWSVPVGWKIPNDNLLDDVTTTTLPALTDAGAVRRAVAI